MFVHCIPSLRQSVSQEITVWARLFKAGLRRSKPIYMHAGHVFDLIWTIQPISMIFGILNKSWGNFKKMLFIFL